VTTGDAQGIHRGRVEWMDTDAAGHHHNTSVTRWVESAEAELMRERRVPGYFGTAPRVRHEVNYESRLWFGQEVTATVVVEQIGTSSMTFAYEVWGEAFEGRPRVRAAVGRYVTVHVPAGAEQSQPWPASWVAALTGRARDASDELPGA
jgi:acyl-CoA thioester hydrolase